MYWISLSMVCIRIVNVVATASLNQELDFYKIRELKGIFHDSDVYGGIAAYFKDEEMQGRVTLFQSGKMISVGTKTEKQAFKELNGAMKFLVKNDFIKEIELYPKVQNIVVMVDLERHINLKELAGNIKSSYEPKRFSGLILHLEEPNKAGVLIFASGKIVVAGLKSSDEINPIVQQIQDLVKLYQ